MTATMTSQRFMHPEVSHFTNVQPTVATRLSCGIDEIDWLYGSNGNGAKYGIPREAMSLWGGDAGVGKTRACMTLARATLNQGLSVLYFTLEMPEGQFKKKYCQGMNSNLQFYISETTDLYEQVQIIKQMKPDLVIVDSVNTIDQFSQRGTKLIRQEYLNALKVAKCHVIFITHLNRAGTIKGGTYLPHMVDIVLTIIPFEYKIGRQVMIAAEDTDCFEVCIPSKNRYGKTGIKTGWAHLEHGAQCQSEFRFEDGDWASANHSKMPVQKRQGFLSRIFGK